MKPLYIASQIDPLDNIMTVNVDGVEFKLLIEPVKEKWKDKKVDVLLYRDGELIKKVSDGSRYSLSFQGDNSEHNLFLIPFILYRKNGKYDSSVFSEIKFTIDEIPVHQTITDPVKDVHDVYKYLKYSTILAIVEVLILTIVGLYYEVEIFKIILLISAYAVFGGLGFLSIRLFKRHHLHALTIGFISFVLNSAFYVLLLVSMSLHIGEPPYFLRLLAYVRLPLLVIFILSFEPTIKVFLFNRRLHKKLNTH